MSQIIKSIKKPFVTIGFDQADLVLDPNDSDHQPEIQTVVDQVLAAGGGTVHFKGSSNIYKLGHEIMIIGNDTALTSDFVFEGDGIGATYFKLNDEVNRELIVAGNGNSDGDGPRDADRGIMPCNNLTFRNFTIDGNKANQTAGNPAYTYGTRNGLRLRADALTSYRALVDNVFAYDCKQNGLSNESQYRTTFRHCYAEESGQGGIWNENGEDFNCIDCWTYNNASGGIRCLSAGAINITNFRSRNDKTVGIQLQSCGRVNLTAFTIERPGYNGGVGDAAANGLNITSSNCQVSGGTIYGSMGNGISLNGVTHSSFKGMLLRRNGQLTNNTYSDILMSGTACTNNNFVGNVFRNDTGTGFTNQVAYNMSGGSTHTANIIQSNQMGAPATSIFNSVEAGNAIRNNGSANPERLHAQGNVTGATTFTRVNGDTITATLTGDITVTLTAGVSRGDRLKLILTQDGTGSRLVTWPSNFKKAGGTLTLSIAAGAVDVIEMIYDGTNWVETSRAMGIS